MSIRLAVACALAVFLLSIALIIGIGLAQPAHPAAVEAAPPAQQSDDDDHPYRFAQRHEIFSSNDRNRVAPFQSGAAIAVKPSAS